MEKIQPLRRKMLSSLSLHKTAPSSKTTCLSSWRREIKFSLRSQRPTRTTMSWWSRMHHCSRTSKKQKPRQLPSKSQD